MKTKRKPTLASQADRYALYMDAVQDPAHEVAFFDRVYRAEFGRSPVVLREDFCGTAGVCYAWMKRRGARRAIGVDLDPEPLAWGRRRLAPGLSPEQRRGVKLVRGDVRRVMREKADVIAAQNFSFWVFTTRAEVLRYFAAARKNLASGGVLVLDMMGGSELLEDRREDKKRNRRYTYVWEQKRFDPVTHACTFAIHFRFPDGSELRDAFTYEWRMWTIPEVTELLREAGFRRADVYWEGEDRATGRANGVYNRRSHGTADPCWVTYVVGVK